MRITAAAGFLVVSFLAPVALRADEPPKGAPVVDAPRPAYPATPKGDVTYDLHGETIADPYRWLEDDDAPAVAAWDAEQQALLRARLDAFPGRAAWKARIDAELDLPSPGSLPTFEGGREWWVERAAGANHGVLYAKPDGSDGAAAGEAKAILDPNAWAADGTAGLRGWFPSPDGKWLAYLRDAKGSERSTLFLHDLGAGKDTPFRLSRMKHQSFCWAADSKGFFYSRQPDPDSVPEGEAEYHTRVLYHALGSPTLDDELVYGTGRPAIEGKHVFASSDRAHVFLARGMPYGPSDFFEIVTTPEGRHRLEPVMVGIPALTSLDMLGEEYVLLTDLDAPKKRLVIASKDEVGDPKRWRTWLARDDVVLEDFAIAAGRVVVHLKSDLASELLVLTSDQAPATIVPLPGQGTVTGGLVTRRGDAHVWFAFDAYERPWTTYRIDVREPRRTPEAGKSAATTLDVTRLVTERATYPSKDGTRIPIFLLHRKDVPLDGKAPTILTGYGGFRVGRYPGWNAAAALWADGGGVYAVACLRGGDEFGEDWHKAGCLSKKQNVFDDFIAGADWLVETGRARREHLGLVGGSNGGLLVAACVNQRPDACRAAISAVPLTDMLRFHRFQYAKTWTKEYGDPDVKEECAWIRPYSPVHNAKLAAYPAVLLTAGLHDGRVNAFHARKMAAVWQAATTSDRPILLSIDRASGHGSASRLQAKADLLDKWTFLQQELSAGR